MKKKIRRRIKKRVDAGNGIDRRSEICKKALDLFIANGYHATSLSMIAKHLNTNKANLYYYFPTKERLLFEIHMEELRKHFVPLLDETEKILDPENRIVFFLKKFVELCTLSASSRVFVHEIRSLNKRHQQEIKLIWRRAYQLLRRAIEELQESGRARKFRESFSSFLGIGMAFWIIYWWDYRKQANAEELAETMVQIFLNGILCSNRPVGQSSTGLPVGE